MSLVLLQKELLDQMAARNRNRLRNRAKSFPTVLRPALDCENHRLAISRIFRSEEKVIIYLVSMSVHM